MKYRNTIKQKINPFNITIALGFIISAITVYVAGNTFLVTSPLLENVLAAKVAFTSFNIVILSALTYNYYKIYKEVPTSMSRGLTIFSAALLLYAITASPILHLIAGFEGITIGVFTYVPDMFVTIAGTIILYESHK